MLPHLTGCQYHQAVVSPEPELRAAKPGTSYRFWLTPERHITLRDVTWAGDSIRGVHRYSGGDSVVTMHRSAARTVEKVAVDGAATFLGVLVLGAGIGLAALASADGWGSPSFGFE
jgi:hypothetical protein